MSSYNTFAQFYDRLTENVDYKVRSDYISNFFYSNNITSGSLLDLACGTGTLSIYFKDKGFDVTGIDLSEDMLCVAASKSNGDINFIKGDITDFRLDREFDCCICALDSINHLENIEAVKSCFNCVHSSLRKDGIFVFDVNTIYKHNFILADNTFVFDEDDFFLSWDNELLEDNVVRIILDFFVFNGRNYDRYTEELCEKAYSVDELTQALEGFELLGVYDELSLDEPKDDSERLYFVCKRL